MYSIIISTAIIITISIFSCVYLQVLQLPHHSCLVIASVLPTMSAHGIFHLWSSSCWDCQIGWILRQFLLISLFHTSVSFDFRVEQCCIVIFATVRSWMKPSLFLLLSDFCATWTSLFMFGRALTPLTSPCIHGLWNDSVVIMVWEITFIVETILGYIPMKSYDIWYGMAWYSMGEALFLLDS